MAADEIDHGPVFRRQFRDAFLRFCQGDGDLLVPRRGVDQEALLVERKLLAFDLKMCARIDLQ